MRTVYLISFILSIVLAFFVISMTLLSAVIFNISYLNFVVFILAFLESYRRERKEIFENPTQFHKLDNRTQAIEIVLLIAQIAVLALLFTYSLHSSNPSHVVIFASAAGVVGLFNFISIGEYLAKLRFFD